HHIGLPALEVLRICDVLKNRLRGGLDLNGCVVHVPTLRAAAIFFTYSSTDARRLPVNGAEHPAGRARYLVRMVEAQVVETLGFVGFGEAAFHLAKGLREAGVKRTLAYDVNAHTPRLGETIEARARETRTELVEFSAALTASAGIIISAVTADQATAAAEQTAPYLTDQHIYADLNSVSPRTKQKVGEIISR